jgi:hypothetical protein
MRVLLAWVAAATAAFIGIWFGTYAAADTDAYGYVSQADLLARGTLQIELDAMGGVRVPENDPAMVPTGYVLSRHRRAAVPMYPPGLPLLMAGAQRLTGTPDAVERRYVDVGRFIARATPADAVFVAGVHSGSIRYYAGRLTLHYPRLRQGSLDLAIDTFARHGRAVYFVLEDGERAEFSSRFSASRFGALDWPAAFRTREGTGISIWDPRQYQTHNQQGAGTPAEIPRRAVVRGPPR